MQLCICDMASENQPNLTIFLSLLYRNILFSFTVRIKFKPLLHDFIGNILQVTDIKYSMQKQRYLLFYD